MNFNGLLEELKDISTTNVLYHFTSLANLIKILESGMIKPKDYIVKSKENTFEICTTRKAGTHKRLQIVGKVNVKITLYKDRIAGNKNYRNIKIVPIDETSKNNIKYLLDMLKGLDLSYKEAMKIINSTIEFLDDKSLRRRTIKTQRIEMVKKFIKEKYDIDITYTFIHTVENYIDDKYLIGDEFEERICFKNKNDGILLDKNIMKIELLDSIKEEFSLFNRTMLNDFQIEKLKQNMEKYKDLFVKNKAYKELKTIIKRRISNEL